MPRYVGCAGTPLITDWACAHDSVGVPAWHTFDLLQLAGREMYGAGRRRRQGPQLGGVGISYLNPWRGTRASLFEVG